MKTVVYKCDTCDFKEEKEVNGDTLYGSSVESVSIFVKIRNKNGDKPGHFCTSKDLCPSCRSKLTSELKELFVKSNFYY